MKYWVYRIGFKGCSKSYIGCTKRMSARRDGHLSQLRHGVHTCLKLQRAYFKYGEDALFIEIIERTNNKARESFWIKEIGLKKLFNKNVGVANASKKHSILISDKTWELLSVISKKGCFVQNSFADSFLFLSLKKLENKSQHQISNFINEGLERESKKKQ